MREMKNSGIEWIGEIPSDWKLPKVKKLFKIGRGRVIAVTEMTPDGKYPVYSSQTKNNGCLGYIDTFDFDQDQLTWTTDGANAGTVFLRRGKHNCTNVCGTLLPYTNDNDLRFLKYALEYIAIFHKRADINGFKIMNNEMADIIITLPSLLEQKKIADFLDEKCAEIDTVIEKTKATIEEYKKLKQSVITQAVTKGIRPNRPMKDSGIEWIGEIPADWSINLIKNIADTCSGGTPNSTDESLYDGDINWVCSYDLKEKPIFESGRKITQLGADSIAGKLQKRGSILIAMYGGSGTIGNSGILECEARTNQAICSIKFNNQYIMDYLGFYYILAIRKHWMIYAVGTRKDPNISQDIVKRMPCVIPSLPEQKEIVDFLDKKCSEIDELIAKKTNLLSELESYKKSLIYEYVTGKKEV